MEENRTIPTKTSAYVKYIQKRGEKDDSGAEKNQSGENLGGISRTSAYSVYAKEVRKATKDDELSK